MQMIINGRDADGSTNEVIEVLNPYTNEVIDTVPSATREDVDEAVRCAAEAQKKWKKVPVYKRAEIVKNFLELVRRDEMDLRRTLSLESGKTMTETKVEWNNLFTAWSAFAEKAKHLYDETIPGGQEFNHDNNIVITKREPIGVVACVVPFNFPCNLFTQKVAPTLLAGNAAIVKPATDNPLTVIKLCRLLREAGVPDGVLQVLTGRGAVVGDYLVAHEGVHVVSLTGSTEVGIAVAKSTAATLKKIALELGGNDAFIVLEDADLDLAVDEAVRGRFFYAGQICCAPKRFIIHQSLYEQFIAAVTERIAAFKAGDPILEDTQVGTLISSKAAKTVGEQIEKTVVQGGKIILGGHVKGAFVEPTVIRDVPFEADIMHDMEVFGPVMPITSFENEDDALALANDTIYGLGGAIFTNNMKKAMKFSAELECGGVVINGSSYFRSFEMPFGGYKYSGVGTEGVMSTFEEVTQTKCVILKGIGNY